jgi:sulfite exporter TauE/SafE
MALSILISAWLVGALGGVHCLAMCGGFIAATAARDAKHAAEGAPLLPMHVLWRRQLVYHAGRVGTYVLLGAAFGGAGGAVLDAAALLPLQRALYLGANGLLLLLAATVAFGRPAVPWLERAGAKAFALLLPRLRPLLAGRGSAARLALGFVWGLVPCALVYSVLPIAMFAGGAWQGAAIMLAFGVGTLPNVVAAGMLMDRAKAVRGRVISRYAVAGIIAAFALVGAYRALWVPGALVQGPFCLVP